jgi:hypothetical protein
LDPALRFKVREASSFAIIALLHCALSSANA